MQVRNLIVNDFFNMGLETDSSDFDVRADELPADIDVLIQVAVEIGKVSSP